MATIFLVVLLLPAILAAPCNQTACAANDNCMCTSGLSPITTVTTPQFVFLSFDDAVTRNIYDTYYTPLLNGRKNPDNNSISATFFVPHEYTDYQCVNLLYNAGHDIGDNSITKNYNASYWTNATLLTLEEEFGGQKDIIAKFANIPAADIRGTRTPQFLLNGDTSFQAYINASLQYDNSWPTLTTSKLFPYTLDYDSGQGYCLAKCPSASFPGFWVVPINNINGNNSIQCNAIMGCAMAGTSAEIRDWLIGEFNKTYLAQKTPFNLLINSAWFLNLPGNFDAMVAFLDYLKPLKDVFIVSEWEAIKWMKKPVTYSTYNTTVLKRTASCNPINCQLQNAAGEFRYMESCVPCPATYPWLGNPQGKA